MNDKNLTLKYLSDDFLKNAPLIENILHDNCIFIYSENDGVLCRLKKTTFYMLTASDITAAKKALSFVDKADLLFVTDDQSARYACEKYNLAVQKPCFQAVYDKTERLSVSPDFIIKQLEPTDENINFVYFHYTLKFSKEHIAFLINKMGIYGAYQGGALIGFIGRHEERSLGLLEVVPEHRRTGAGYALEAFMINKALDEGSIPYAHIIKGNDKSLALQNKLGFSIYDKLVFWCEGD